MMNSVTSKGKNLVLNFEDAALRLFFRAAGDLDFKAAFLGATLDPADEPPLFFAALFFGAPVLDFFSAAIGLQSEAEIRTRTEKNPFSVRVLIGSI